MITETEQEIQNYTNAIKAGDLPKPPEVCPRCAEEIEEFKLHDQRERTFLVIVGSLVKAVVTWLVRYRCPNPKCKHRFTCYPDFALPYKRYALPVVTELSERYVTSKTSCMEATKEGNNSIGYPDGRLFEPTTIWRWLDDLGGLGKTLSKGLAMIEQKCPDSEVLRNIKPVLPCKHRSEKRKLVLQAASRLLSIRAEYKKLFSRPVFPRFARVRAAN